MTFDMNLYLIFLLASCRAAGVIFFNPIFGRGSVPNVLKIGLSLVLAMYSVYQIGNTQVIDYSIIEFVGAMLQGFAIGLLIGFIMQFFLSAFQISGELIDMQIGLSMASMYDPSTKANITWTGNMFGAMYVLLFFVSDCHIALFNVVIKSYQVIPVGLGTIDPHVGVFFVELISYIFLYALQVAMPIVVVELIAEFAVGIMMRLVPNISVFVINLQLKIIIGMIIILTIIPTLAGFMTRINMIMMEKITQMLSFFM